LTHTALDGDYLYNYDKLDRLTEATLPTALTQLPKEKYDYDGVHNRMFSEHQVGAWVYNPIKSKNNLNIISSILTLSVRKVSGLKCQVGFRSYIRRAIKRQRTHRSKNSAK
jgi:YD repeat-containing protein